VFFVPQKKENHCSLQCTNCYITFLSLHSQFWPLSDLESHW